MVTGFVDTEYHLTANNEIAVNHSHTDHTNFTHIFPPSTSQDLEPEQPDHSKVCCSYLYVDYDDSLMFMTVQTHYAGTVWGIVLNYGDINALDELNGLLCHRLSNGLTLTASVRNDFDRLQLWFDAIPVSDIPLYSSYLISIIIERPTYL